ncbi:tRNA threonylcarbamoyladenosine biosynthesis protein TsaE [Sulfurivirga caldicuralii]|uniref:tRNA threonylcarbamoyladenosine biosynthesis protein TsaE n=1 Tax=Sulfurivirga caldicuralii TaxID=364032 RepID=A0A1N6F2Z0_9GAMM|nr:tRNA threonylcarbamoyladenosine biosynthesis protein TsaE [Sulfurivirga caldicuralii]
MRCEDEAATRALAERLAHCLVEHRAFEKGTVLALYGDLGTGKTFFARALIQALLPDARVKSPTYTLFERYDTSYGPVYHWDLYRLCEPEELEYVGLRDLLQPPCLHIVEWPEKGAGVLPDADITVSGQVCGEQCRLFTVQIGMELV